VSPAPRAAGAVSAAASARRHHHVGCDRAGGPAPSCSLVVRSAAVRAFVAASWASHALARGCVPAVNPRTRLHCLMGAGRGGDSPDTTNGKPQFRPGADSSVRQ